MSNLRKIISGSIFVFVAYAIFAIFAYLNKVLLARYLGPSQFGLYTLALTVIYIFTAFAIAGVGTSITYYLSKEKSAKKKNAFFSALLVLAVVSLSIISSILILFSKQVSIIFGNPAIQQLSFVLSAFAFLFGITQVLYSILRGEEKPKAFAFFYSLIPLLFFTQIFIFKFRFAQQALFAYMFSYLIVGSLLVIYSLKSVKFVKPDFKILKSVLAFSFVLFLVELISSIRRWTDVWMLSLLSTIKQIGYYNVAISSAFLFNTLLIAINFLYLPMANKLQKGGKLDEVRRLYSQLCAVLTFISFPIAIGLVIFSKQFVFLFFGPKYIPSISPFIVLVLASLFNVIFGPNWTNLIIHEEKKALLGLAVTTIVVNIILNYLWIPIWGITGAALATATSIIIWNIMTTTVIWIKYKMTPFSTRMAKSILLAIVLAIPFMIFYDVVASLRILYAILLGGVYLVVYTFLANYFVIKLNGIMKLFQTN